MVGLDKRYSNFDNKKQIFKDSVGNVMDSFEDRLIVGLDSSFSHQLLFNALVKKEERIINDLVTIRGSDSYDTNFFGRSKGILEVNIENKSNVFNISSVVLRVEIYEDDTFLSAQEFIISDKILPRTGISKKYPIPVGREFKLSLSDISYKSTLDK